jgi:branched-chain amino acid transport system permease protein
MIVILAIVAAFFAGLIFGGNYALRLATIFAMYATLALPEHHRRPTGYPSFATAAFFGLGTYASAILQSSGMPMLLAWPLGGLTAAVFAAIIGLAILHLKGHYFAIASLALVEVLRELVNINDRFTGGGMGSTRSRRRHCTGRVFPGGDAGAGGHHAAVGRCRPPRQAWVCAPLHPAE